MDEMHHLHPESVSVFNFLLARTLKITNHLRIFLNVASRVGLPLQVLA